MYRSIVTASSVACSSRLRRCLIGGSLLIIALLYGFYPLSAALATSYHTITIDGVNDFAADEDVPGTSGSTWYFSWDAANIYVGTIVSDVAIDSSTKWVHLYLDTDPEQTPTGGTGSTSGVLYNTQQPGLPFSANYHLRWKADNTFTELMVWDGAAWVAADQTGVAAFQNGTFVEFRIPRAKLGSPASVYVAGGIINEISGGEYTYFMTPSSNTEGYDANYSNWLGFVLSEGLAPDAAANVNCTPANVVASTADAGTGSLRQAVVDACNAGVITFAPSLADETITLMSGEIGIAQALTIDGVTAPGLAVSGNNTSRIFNVTSGGNLNLTRLILQRGNPGTSASGGAIFVDGAAVALDTVTLRNNSAQRGGGLLVYKGKGTITNSTIISNTAIQGGGLNVDIAATAAVFNSTIAYNRSVLFSGGGIINFGNLTLENSTVSGNRAATDGGGIRLTGSSISAVINHSTITSNTADDNGGGISRSAGTATVRNTIVAGNFDTPNNAGSGTKHPDISGALSGNAYNLIGTLTGATGTIGTGTDLIRPVPGLGPLADNGGPTLTHALLPGSPAYNAGDPLFEPPPVTDQRGLPRDDARRIDIGPFELADTPQAGSLVVNSVADPGSGGCTVGECTLREALTAANTAPNVLLPDFITFNIPGSGVQTITPLSALPTISEPVFLDATTQPGASCVAPAIEVNGSSAGAGVTGLTITGGSSIVRGLVINRFAGNGMVLSGSGSNIIQCNFIGTNAAGTTDLGNALVGINIDGSANNIIGGSSEGTRNLVSGNNSDGVKIAGVSASGNVVQGNYIGTSSDGNADLGNSSSGVYIFNVPANAVGGSMSNAGNLISGNNGNGVYVAGASASGSLVAGNLIGTNAAGTAALGNTFNGVVLDGATNSSIGGSDVAARNVIASNGANGINIINAASGTSIQGNYIGTDSSGTLDRGNAQSGVRIAGASGNTVGGSGPGTGNVLSGNTFNGVVVENGPATNNSIVGNFIGTDEAGTAALPNSLNGVQIATGASGNLVGGTTAGAGNLISGNTQNGVHLTTAGNSVAGNTIGLNAGGTAKLANGQNGVFINNAADNIVGGTAASARNVISGNALDGISINGTSTGTLVQGNYIGTNAAGTAALGNANAGIFIGTSANHTLGGTAAGAGNLLSGNTNGIYLSGAASTGNQIQGNIIGLNAAGNAPLGNTSNGIVLDGAVNNIIGGTSAAARNVISGNGNNGINMFTAGTSGNLIQGNYIGTDVSGTVDLGNFLNGIRMFGVNANTVGGTVAGAGNLLAGNNQHGIFIAQATAVGNVLQGNTIGTQANGTTALANALDGVRIDVNAPSNTLIGGSAAGAGNIIAFNNGRGINVLSGTGHRISGNAIFSNGNLGIDLGNNGLTPNDAGDADPGPNNLQNFPVLSVATAGTSTTGVAGSLNSTPDTTFSIEFFSNIACDPTGFGEGELLRGTASVTTDGSGAATFSAVLPSLVPGGQFLTATATDPNGNTSEFAQCISVDAPPALLIVDNSVVEGNAGPTNLVFTVTLSAGSAQTITVDYATADGTATQPADYAPTSGTLTFAPFQTTGTITVAVTGDTVNEPNETFSVLLSNPVNATLSDAQGFGTIINDDAYRVFLPLIIKSGQADLIVEQITASATGVSVVIKNQGDAPVIEPFWVDVYIDPTTPPTAVNQTWDQVGTQGLVWGIEAPALPLKPGASLTLTIGDGYYHPELSRLNGPLAPETPIYAQVDSANITTTYGSVLETHEASGAPYNNILGPVNATVLMQVALPDALQQRSATSQLPPRP